MVTSRWKQECAGLEVPSLRRRPRDSINGSESRLFALARSHRPIQESFRPPAPVRISPTSISARTTPPFFSGALCTLYHPNKVLNFSSIARPLASQPLDTHTHYKDGWSRRIGACFRFLGGWLYAKYKSLRESEEWAEEKKVGGTGKLGIERAREGGKIRSQSFKKVTKRLTTLCQSRDSQRCPLRHR